MQIAKKLTEGKKIAANKLSDLTLRNFPADLLTFYMKFILKYIPSLISAVFLFFDCMTFIVGVNLLWFKAMSFMVPFFFLFIFYSACKLSIG